MALRVRFAHTLRSYRASADLTVERGETVALVGPSGAGKTTVLRVVAGLLRPDEGYVALDDEVLLDTAQSTDVPPERRRVGYLFQEYALFPHLDVWHNVRFGARRNDDVELLLERFRIGALAKARIDELSGGERQRVALARALARDPALLLLDEPLSALDAHTRAGVRADLRELLEALGLPAILVTHDFEDAATLAHRVGVISEGEVLQLATPTDLVATPRDAFVASFTGATVLPGRGEPRRPEPCRSRRRAVGMERGRRERPRQRRRLSVGGVARLPHARRLAHEPRERGGRVGRADGQPDARPRRADRGGDHSRVGRAPRPPARSPGDRVVQGDGRAALPSLSASTVRPVARPRSKGREGGCSCGAIRYRLTSEPLFVHCCHCLNCQRQTGSAFVINVLIEAARVELLQGEPVAVDVARERGKQRIWRCPTCQVALYSKYTSPKVRFVRAGTLDDPSSVEPEVHIFTRSKLPWVRLPESTPAFNVYYDTQKLWPAESLERLAALRAT
jgi:ABC-type sulfate/molybdate transport systems ATPase subunit